MLLVIRELLCGSTQFSELRRGLGRISPSVLSQRLQTLEDYDLLKKETDSTTKKNSYHLTKAGQELFPVVEKIGIWGSRWIRSKMTEEDMDVDLLMWDIRRRLLPNEMKINHVVIEIVYTDIKNQYRNWWLLVDDGEVDLCYEYPGREVDFHIETKLPVMSKVWMGDITIQQALKNELMKITGNKKLNSNLLAWLNLSIFAGVKAAVI